MKLVKVPAIADMLYPSMVWRMPADEKVIYLTFDDGPNPDVTPKVLRILEEYGAKATFFCLGENVVVHHYMFNLILKAGHKVGNHGYQHLNGWKTNTRSYADNFDLASPYIRTDLIRPPYGKIRHSQIRHLREHYRIIGWSVMAYDFDKSVSPRQCFNNIVNNVTNGSIVVLHENDKSAHTMLTVLPQVLKHFAGKGFVFKSL